jgi:hypothetical protein
MNNPHFNNMHSEMRDSPGFRYRYRNASPRAQQPPAMQGPPGRHSCASGPPPSALMFSHAEAFSCHPRMSASGQRVSIFLAGVELAEAPGGVPCRNAGCALMASGILPLTADSCEHCALRHELLLQAAAEASAGAPDRLRGWSQRDQASAAAAARHQWQGRPESMGMLLPAKLCC